MDSIVIVGMARTPMGGLQGELSGFSANAARRRRDQGRDDRSRHHGPDVDAGLSWAACCRPDRARRRRARPRSRRVCPNGAGATTINKMCGSGMQAAMGRRRDPRRRAPTIVVAGGMEIMTNAPYLRRRRAAATASVTARCKDSHVPRRPRGRLRRRRDGQLRRDMSRRNTSSPAKQQDAYALALAERAQAATKRRHASSARSRRSRVTASSGDDAGRHRRAAAQGAHPTRSRR